MYCVKCGANIDVPEEGFVSTKDGGMCMHCAELEAQRQAQKKEEEDPCQLGLF